MFTANITHTALIWGFTVIALLTIFMLRFAQHFRQETHHSGHFIELENEDAIHYEQDGDE